MASKMDSDYAMKPSLVNSDYAIKDQDYAIKPALVASTSLESSTKDTVASVGRDHISLKPHASYEGGHRWDPLAEWTSEEEARVVRKADLYLLSWICLMFFGLQLDRGNIANALTDDMLADLGMNTNDYNNVSAISTHSDFRLQN